MSRSNLYDSLPAALSNLKAAAIRKEKVIQKADQSTKLDLDSLTEGLATADKQSDLLCRLIYGMFTALRNDYIGNSINTARYTATLKPIKEFLDENPKIDNACLNRKEILDEANLYL